MTIEIPRDLEEFILGQIQAGRFSDPQTMVIRAITAMREIAIVDSSDEQALRQAIQLGLDDLANGRKVEWDSARIKADARRLMSERIAHGG